VNEEVCEEKGNDICSLCAPCSKGVSGKELSKPTNFGLCGKNDTPLKINMEP